MKNTLFVLLQLIVILSGKYGVHGQEMLVKFIIVHDSGQQHHVDQIASALKNNDINPNNDFDLIAVELEENGNDFDKMCNAFAADGTFIVDISWSGYEPIKEISKTFNAPYLRVDVSISPYLDLLNAYLDARNTTDVALIFNDARHVDQTLYYWIDTTKMRMVVTEKLDSVTSKRLKDMRPTPHAYTLITNTATMNTLYKQVTFDGLLKLPERWNLLLLDFEHESLQKKEITTNVNILYLDKELCCGLKAISSCDCSTADDLYAALLDSVIKQLLPFVRDLVKEPQTGKIQCNDTQYDQEIYDGFHQKIDTIFGGIENVVIDREDILRIRAQGVIETMNKDGEAETVANYDGNALEVEKPAKLRPVKPYYRIGTAFAMPWSYEEVDPVTGAKYWTGYCVDFADKLSELMGFDYDIVIPENGQFGEKDIYGNWDGVVGDLVRGQTDLAVSALTMTADREEVIDFVAPYYEQVGITIVMRKPVRKTSLFKFMTVLKLEVWLSIVGALVVTGFMVWFLDKYSPYSARNNKKAYPYPTRQFNLKESFWFALTSFTPQGGGEAPKALSGRTLVAAYWLFVVLMLATFTANLAAFLTVERMQTPVQSLEQLARQSRINYTVVESSETHKYFINMKNAEDTLYRMWKELTLNASTDNTQYRVWDYPIHEQYGQILIAINDSIPMATAKDGFDKVDERLDADFAFIHDSAEIKYEISRNCNLTEVGEVFAERPYAVAIQQGSHLQDTISIMILDLQKDRFFEALQAKYWNHSMKGDCASADDNEGITLESLGGVFIATLFGLVLAMLTLAGEVFYYNQKKKKEESMEVKKVVPMPEKENFVKPGGTITIGDSFKPVKSEIEKMRVSHIALYPRSRNRLPHIE